MSMRISAPTVALAAALLASAAPARADITFYDFFKTVAYSQTSDFAPTVPIGYFGSANVESNNSTDLTGAVVSFPASTPPDLTLSGSGGFYSTGTPLGTKAAMDAVIPNGVTSTFTLTGGTLGGQMGSLATPDTDQYTTTVPFFSGTTYSTLQNFNVANSITLNFAAFTPFSNLVNSATTFIDISQVGGPSVFGTRGASTLTSAFVGGGVLQADTTYDLSLVYSDRIIVDGGFPGSTAFIGYDVRVDLIFTTAAAVPEPSSLALCGIAGTAGLGIARLRRRKRTA